MKPLIAPSILAADKSKLIEEILDVEHSGANYLHIDIMDGIFVPNVSLSKEIVKEIHDKHHMVNDVHIMINNPLEMALDFVNAGADVLTFHYEALSNDEDILKTINIIRDNNAKVGISIKPGTDVKVLLPYLDKIDLVLIMSVEPGFGGQKFMPNSLEKISYLRKYIDDHKLNVLIEVDGGINKDTAKLVKEAGVDILVAGTYIFNAKDRKERIDSLR